MSSAPVKEEFNYTVNYSSECFTMRWDSKKQGLSSWSPFPHQCTHLVWWPPNFLPLHFFYDDDDKEDDDDDDNNDNNNDDEEDDDANDDDDDDDDDSPECVWHNLQQLVQV